MSAFEIAVLFVLVVIAISAVAIAFTLRKAKAPVFNLQFDQPDHTFNNQFQISFPAIPQPEVPKFTLNFAPPNNDFHVTFPEIPQRLPDTLNLSFSAPQNEFHVNFPEIPQPDPITVQLPQIQIPPSTVIVTHGVPANTNGGAVVQMHAPMTDEEVEIIDVSRDPYRIVGRRSLDHPDLAEARRDPKLAVRYSNGDIDDGSGRKAPQS